MIFRKRLLASLLLCLGLAIPAHGQLIGTFGTATPLIPPVSNSIFLACLGDSITAETSNVETYCNLYQGTSSIFLDNEAVSGEGCDFTLATEVPRAISSKNAHPGYTYYFASVLIGVNDVAFTQYYDPSSLANLAISAQNMANCIGSVATALHAGGFTKVAIATLTDFGSKDGLGEIWRAEVAADEYALYPATVDGIIDFAGLPIGFYGIGSDMYFYRDDLHPILPGHFQMEGQEYGLVINSFVGGSTAPANPTAITQGATKSNSIVLNWAKPCIATPNCTGGYFSDFTTQYSVHGSGIWSTYSHTASRTPQAVLTGLVPSTAYDIRIQAVGQSANSQFVYFTTSATPSTTADTFDTSSFYTNAPACVLSNSNLTVTARIQFGVSGQQIGCTLRSNISQSSGKWYTELFINAIGVAQPQFGFCDATFPTIMPNDEPGVFLNSASNGVNGNLQQGFTLATSFTAPTVNASDYFMFAFDLGAQKAWLGKNGTWLGSGNPATGVNPWVTWTGPYTLSLCVQIAYNATQVTYPGASPHYSAPTGFSVLWLLNRDLDPANDNMPAFLNKAA